MNKICLSLDTTLLLDQIRELGEIGRTADQAGRTRIALTQEDKAGRDLLVRWMRELNLIVKVDQLGNLFGILPGLEPNTDQAPLMIGSHIDTVKNAGAVSDRCNGATCDRKYRASDDRNYGASL